MKWNDLTMAQKSELMKIYIKNGVTSINDMRSHFNTYANGGPKKTYKEWATQMHTKYPWLELDSNKAGYDYEKYFNENYDDAIARLNEVEARHFTDRYKLPNHPTFSNESIYSQGPSIGGSWTKDDKFIPSVINTQQHPNIYREFRPYTEDEIYGRKFAAGGDTQPDNPPFVLPVNSEGLPQYTLPELEVTSSRIYGKDFEDFWNKHHQYAGRRDKNQAYDIWIRNNHILNKHNQTNQNQSRGLIDYWNYAKNYLSNKLGKSSPIFLDLTDKNVQRITNNTNNVSSILFNEFLEDNNNTFRQKKDFVNTNDTLLGDRQIPLRNISTFYGVEDGRLKIGSINTFNDNTIIAPNRLKNVGKIKEIIVPEYTEEDYPTGFRPRTGKKDPYYKERKQARKALEDYIKQQYTKETGEKPRIFNKQYQHFYSNLYRSLPENVYDSIQESYGIPMDARFHTGRIEYTPQSSVVTDNNDTIPLHLNGPKIIFGDESGNTIFASNLKDRDILRQVNDFLRENPSYPLIVDNGRYSQYYIGNPSIYSYTGFTDPNHMFIIGTTK